ncbi:MAG: hypothetical protein HC781_20845 [Leptolyngbyaceae cyanobacterium CSU_1_4]|nr:hypothetical protein [Leptolyngbyaceae cyanobacterium CSU_1_4]
MMDELSDRVLYREGDRSGFCRRDDRVLYREGDRGGESMIRQGDRF